jgi:alpha-glucosidase (family GH31 glycosyl hydrolase)
VDEASRRGDTSLARSAYRRRLLAWARSLVVAGLLVAVAVPAVRGVAGGPAGCAAPLAGRADSQRGDRQDRRDRLTATRANAQRVGGSTSADGLLWSLLVQLRLWDQDGCMLQAGPSWTVCVSADGTTTAETAIRRPGAGKPVGKLTVVARAVSPGVVAVRVTPAPTARASTIGFRLPAGQDEHFFGLGERFRGPCLLGQVVDNWSEGFNDKGRRTSYSPMPLLLSSKGYGVLLATSARARFDVAATRQDAVTVRVETGALHLDLIPGPDLRAVVGRAARLVGLPPLPPRWGLGVWKTLIGGQQRVERDLRRLRRDAIPIDAVWVYDATDDRSGFGWPWQIYQPIPPGPYPDLRGLIDRLHRQGLKVLGYLNPFVYVGAYGYDEARRRGYLVHDATGRPIVAPWCCSRSYSWVDFTNPAATAWWQARVGAALDAVGFDGAMQDFGEDLPADARLADGQSAALVHNRYPVLFAKAAHQAAQAVKPGGAVFFDRSGYLGSQPYTTGRFTGDQVRTWDRESGIGAVVPAMLSGSLSGWPYWGPDIAAYAAHGELADAEEKELWIRWVQLGALAPVMRDHLGSQTHDPVELWTDPDTVAVFRAYARLHTAIEPYLYRYAVIAHQRGLPIVRPLFLNYPTEPQTYALDDEYLLGDDLLVAPVLTQGQVVRRLYLPAGRWSEYWTGRRHRGPGWIEVDAPLHQIPLLVRREARVNLPSPRQLWRTPSSDTDPPPGATSPGTRHPASPALGMPSQGRPG